MNPNRPKSKSPQFGQARQMQSKSRSPDMPKMGDYKRNQLIQHLKKMKQMQTKTHVQERPQREPTQQELMDDEVRQFKQEIEKKFLLSIHNHQFKFPYTEASDEDDSLRELSEVTVYTLKDQNTVAQKNLVAKTFESRNLDKMMEHYQSQTQHYDHSNLLSAHAHRNPHRAHEDVNKRIKTEGDDTDFRIINTLKTTKKINYYQQPQKPNNTQMLYDTIKSKMPKPLSIGKTLAKSQSPQAKALEPPIRQRPVLKSPQGRNEQLTPNRKVATYRLPSTKSNTSQITKEPPKEIESRPITNANGRLHNYYFSQQNNNSSLVKQYSTAGARPNATQPAKNSFRYPTQIANQSSRAGYHNVSTTRSKNHSRNKRVNQSTESNHSDSSYKSKLAIHQDKLKELLKKSKPFYI